MPSPIYSKKIIAVILIPICCGIAGNLLTPIIGKFISTSVPLWIAAASMGLGVSICGIFIRNGRNSLPVDENIIRSQGHLLVELRSAINSATTEVSICNLNKEWFFLLLPTIAICLNRGVPVRLFVPDSDHHRRYRLLTLLGGEVIIISEKILYDTFSGFVVDPSNSHHGVAVTLSIKPSNSHFGSRYQCPLHHHVIRSLGQSLDLLGGSVKPAHFKPDFVKVSESELFRKLAGVRAYKRSSFTYEEVDISDVLPISRSVRTVKLKQAEELIDLYNQLSWRLFEPSAITLINGEKSLLVPPVVEIHDGKKILAEGHSRLYAAKRRGVEHLHVVVVRQVSESPAQDPVSWKEVSEHEERIEISSPRARHIETAAHIDLWNNEVWEKHKTADQ